ncbi:MAG TPA: protein kinase [Verrucomicrobiae bacterium]|jgi:serine/threonine protein kinase|nr:protein kinase [Verrucomicrobiae bacterium]
MSLSQDPSEYSAPVSVFVGPVGEMIAQRMLSPPSRPGVLAMLDHFEIIRILGGGGMGIVLLARNSQTGRDAAVKLVKSGLVTNQEVVHRFLKEASHLKRLRHINIVSVDEISERLDAPYFAMPYFEKGSLANRMTPGEPLKTMTILDIATQVADGLSFAHRTGIIHRDLKPANILVAANDRVCLADFGLARTVFNDTIVDVENRTLEGTAPYMSPAVAAGDAEDTRCDIYSFGALLYEMLTGHAPYKGRNTKEILDKIIAGPPNPIKTLNPSADPRLVAVSEKAMARELRNRYADMRDVFKDLEQIKEGKDPNGSRKTASHSIYLWRSIPAVIVILVVALFWALSRKTPPASMTTPPPTVATSAPKPVTAQPPAANPVTVPQPAPPAPVQQPAPVPAPAPVLETLTFAGQPGVKGYTNGPALQAEFRLPNNVAVDAAGNVYVADTANDVIRKITPAGEASTVAGLPHSRGSADGSGTNTARFWSPFGIALDTAGDIFVADTGNNTIRKISPAGDVTTIAGLAGQAGTNDGVGSLARFRNPWDVAVDKTGDVYVADMSNDTIRKISPDGRVHTFAGQSGDAGNTDGWGNSARFNNPFGVAVDSAGNVYVSDTANNTIRKITEGRVVTTLAGTPGNAGNTDGNGTDARFWSPQGLTVDSAGNIYVADTSNNVIRKITPMGVVTTLPVSPDKTLALNAPGGVAIDTNGNIYVADSNNHCIRKIAAK